MLMKITLNLGTLILLLSVLIGCQTSSSSLNELVDRQPAPSLDSEEAPEEENGSGELFANIGSCQPSGFGTDYPVGPGQPYSSLSDVPWDNLGPGDTVRIHYRPTPYREKIVIRTDGSEEQPIRICGVAGSEGQKPILDGDGAVNDPDDREAYGSYRPMEGLAMVMLWNRDYDLKVHNIVIDGLHIRNAKNNFRYTRMNGSTSRYEDGAACIRIQAADNVVIRNNELENCGNGIFTMSQEYNEASLTRNLLIEGNYIHSNGQPGSYLEHGVYIQAIGVTYQYNHFGPNAAGAEGATLKERVAGSVIRYNRFDSGSTRVLDLVEVEDAAPWYLESAYRQWANDNGESIDPERLEKVRRAEAAYRKTYVYGNLIRHVGSKTPAANLIHYGWDNDPEYARRGALYFYNNTLVLLNDREDSWRIRLFDMYPYDESRGIPAEEKVLAFNNIVYQAAETPGATPSYFCLGRDSGTIELGINWISNGWNAPGVQEECYGQELRPVITGTEKLLHTSGEPAPVNLETLEPVAASPVLGRAQQFPKEIGARYAVEMQYHMDGRVEPRPSAADLGAIEGP